MERDRPHARDLLQQLLRWQRHGALERRPGHWDPQPSHRSAAGRGAQAEVAQRQLSRWLRGLIVVHASFGSANASLAKFFREQAVVMAPPPRAAPTPRPAHPDAAFAPLGARPGGGGGGEAGGRPRGLAA
jgi:hypothetical protein